MKSFIRILKWTSYSLIVLIVIILSDTFLRRYTFLNLPDVYDYKKLPVRVVEKGSNSTNFPVKTPETGLSNIFPLTYYEHDIKKISDLDTLLKSNYSTAFIIIRNDTILYEKYFNGHNRDTYCKCFSASKNVISALIGIAIDEKLIHSVNDPVTKYLPDFKDNKYLSAVTIKNCLSGTAGFPANDGGAYPWHDNVKVYYNNNHPKLLSGLKWEFQPGSQFRAEEYSSCLLSLVLEKATNMTVSEYLSEKIWKPAGMEYDALWVLDGKKSGHEVAMSGLTARPVDFAKFACMYLNNGNWNGNEIVSENWIKNSTRPDSTLLSNWKGGYYNSTWWGTLKEKDIYEYSANGHFAQRIYISPYKNAVVVRFGTKTGNMNWSEFISTIIEKL